MRYHAHMKSSLIAMILALGGAGLLVWFTLGSTLVQEDREPNTQNQSTSTDETSSVEEPTIVAENLMIPWDMVFLPDNSILVSERGGNIVRITDGVVYPIEGVVHTGEAGLLGMALHPNFSENNFLYVYLTTSIGEDLVNNIVRYTYRENTLTFDRVIFDTIPASRFHDGGRIAFGPDGYLYVTVGDAQNEHAAQNPQSLAGSILRITAEGEIPSGNPFGNAVYSYGHRNPQGLAWDGEGRLWSTEHGRSGIRSGYDEVNLIEAGGNYGWPESEGDAVAAGTVAPAAHSSASATWAPASAVYYDGSIFFGGLRGEALYEAVLKDKEVVEVREHLSGAYGRIRTVAIGPDGNFYLTTSNRDGRGSPEANDDRIIRVDPRQFRE